ncbi:MAG: hydantoin utilization protein [Sphaerospermopsis sp. SIO1G2]|nr:hydantoin utilization protein [Sphaerospermopsis sp. SIO1G2]
MLASSGGSSIQHGISNPWEGFIWGIAEPVLSLDQLACIVAIGLLSVRFIRGVHISMAFVLAAFCGQVIHLNLLSAELPISTVSAAIAICTIISGMMFIVLPTTEIAWLAVTILAILGGLSQGYVDSQAVISTDVVTKVIYLLAVTLTQAVIILSVRKVSTIISKKAVNQLLPTTIHWIGLTFCAIGVVFLSNVLI